MAVSTKCERFVRDNRLPGTNPSYHAAAPRREFRRAGVTEGVIMKAAGWRTRSMFDRYNIIDEDDLARSLAKRFNANGKQAANTASPLQPEPFVTPSSTRSSLLPKSRDGGI